MAGKRSLTGDRVTIVLKCHNLDNRRNLRVGRREGNQVGRGVIINLEVQLNTYTYAQVHIDIDACIDT
jgi:hypothetical protein